MEVKGLKRDRISARQFYLLMAAALMAPTVRALPARTAAVAGEAAWLTGIAAFPVLLLEGWVAAGLLRRGEGGLAPAFCRALGPALGKGLTILYMVWALFLLCLEARLAAERMVATGYRGGDLRLFLAVVLALALWLGRRKLTAFARTAEIFYLVLTLVLALVLAFALLDATPGHILPVWAEDLPPVLAATAVPVGALSRGVLAAFLWGEVAPEPGASRRGLGWLAWGCIGLTLLQLGVLAQLGPQLAARLDSPFFEVARGVGVSGAFQRVESVVVALWLFGDLAMLGVLIFACRAMGRTLVPKAEKVLPWAVTAVALLGAVFLFPEGSAAKAADENWVPWVNFFLALPLPAGVLLVDRARNRGG